MTRVRATYPPALGRTPWAGLLALLLACGTPSDAGTPGAPAKAEPDASAAQSDTTPPGHAPSAVVIDPAATPLHLVTDPRLLARWDADASAPLSLHTIIGRIDGKPLPAPPAGDPTTGASLDAAHADGEPSHWRSIADTLAADVTRVVEEMAIDWEDDITRTYDRSAAKTEQGGDLDHRGNGNVARVLRAAWLRSPDARFPLAAVVYRPDRRDFIGGCGELRLIYRLAYEHRRDDKLAASRLPLTINVVFEVPDDGEGCRAVAQRWRAEPLHDGNVAQIADAWLAGPLAPGRARFRQLEINAQLVRFPSDLERVDGRGFAGQAMYGMRVFAPDGGRLRPAPLENTPDVQAIRHDPGKRTALVTYIREHLREIDEGTFVLPRDLLADVALSWSTHGSVRLANRPFSAILSDAEAREILAGAPLPAPGFVGDARGLLERLDASSCMGCHQHGSTAGFHMLGVDRPFGRDPDAVMAATDGNRVQLPFSPHVAAELPRRTAYLAALVAGTAPERLRPHPGAPPRDTTEAEAIAAEGAPCPLPGDALAPASRWRCADDLICEALANHATRPTVLGMCVPSVEALQAGDPCLAATIEDGPALDDARAWLSFNIRSFTDRIAQQRPRHQLRDGGMGTAALRCRPMKIGVPLGRVSRNCRDDERTLAAVVDDPHASELCAIVGGRGFEAMATGVFDQATFARSVVRGRLDPCDAQRPCREDYICQALPDFLAHGDVAAETLARLHARGLGFCTPTYFVYQLRLDGHPNPTVP